MIETQFTCKTQNVKKLKQPYSKFIFIMSDEMRSAITDYSKNNGLKQAEVVRMAIQSFFELPTKRQLIAKIDNLLGNIK